MRVIEENLSSFGMVLKTFRKRRHLTQQQLAEVIGVHRSTLINWEQGRDEQAEALFQRALRIREQTLGPDHALVARPLTGLANLACDRGQYAQAEALFREPETVTGCDGL